VQDHDPKEVILTTMEAFDPSRQDAIEQVSLGRDSIEMRVVRISEIVRQAVEATQQRFARDLRDRFMGEVERGERLLPLVERIEVIKDELGLWGVEELGAAWLSVWTARQPEDEERKLPEPDRSAWDEAQYRTDLLRLFVIETLAQIEMVRIPAVLPKALLDIGQLKSSDELDEDEQTKRLLEVIDRETTERIRHLRQLPGERVWKRLYHAAAVEPAFETAQQCTRVLMLYACARKLDDRNAFFFDLSAVGITSVAQALREPQKAYDAMLAEFKGDERILGEAAQRIVIVGGALSPQMAARLEEAAKEPFCPKPVRNSTETGAGARVGGDVAAANPSEHDVPGASSVVLGGRKGRTKADRKSGASAPAEVDYISLSDGVHRPDSEASKPGGGGGV